MIVLFVLILFHFEREEGISRERDRTGNRDEKKKQALTLDDKKTVIQNPGSFTKLISATNSSRALPTLFFFKLVTNFLEVPNKKTKSMFFIL